MGVAGDSGRCGTSGHWLHRQGLWSLREKQMCADTLGALASTATSTPPPFRGPDTHHLVLSELLWAGGNCITDITTTSLQSWAWPMHQPSPPPPGNLPPCSLEQVAQKCRATPGHRGHPRPSASAMIPIRIGQIHSRPLFRKAFYRSAATLTELGIIYGCSGTASADLTG